MGKTIFHLFRALQQHGIIDLSFLGELIWSIIWPAALLALIITLIVSKKDEFWACFKLIFFAVLIIEIIIIIICLI